MITIAAPGSGVRATRGAGGPTFHAGGLPEADLATAHRVLATVTERANAELAR